MSPREFRILLLTATTSAIDFARRFVTDDLSPDCRYQVLLNQSYDGHATPDETLYPEDDGLVLVNQTADQVVDRLCRNGKCPEWIDIAVAAVNPHFTLLNLLCCGRYTADRSKMYYHSCGLGPFGVKSPNLPPGFADGVRFRLPPA